MMLDTCSVMENKPNAITQENTKTFSLTNLQKRWEAYQKKDDFILRELSVFDNGNRTPAHDKPILFPLNQFRMRKYSSVFHE
jgi:hypothetical protein